MDWQVRDNQFEDAVDLKESRARICGKANHLWNGLRT